MDYYENNAKKLSQRYESADVSEIQSLLLKSFVKNSSLLEIGCGSGRDASFMLKHGFDVYAIDGSEQMISEAKKLHPELKDRLGVQILPDGLLFEKEIFDGIYSIATLMHLTQKEIDKTIKKISSLLKQKGIFIFSVSIQRDDIDENNQDVNKRNFTTLPQKYWLDSCKACGLHTLQTITTSDGLDREGIVWLTCVVEKKVD